MPRRCWNHERNTVVPSRTKTRSSERPALTKSATTRISGEKNVASTGKEGGRNMMPRLPAIVLGQILALAEGVHCSLDVSFDEDSSDL